MNSTTIRAHRLPERLANILKARGVTSYGIRDFIVTDDGDGHPPRLAHWNVEVLGTVPTQEQIDAADEFPLRKV